MKRKRTEQEIYIRGLENKIESRKNSNSYHSIQNGTNSKKSLEDVDSNNQERHKHEENAYSPPKGEFTSAPYIRTESKNEERGISFPLIASFALLLGCAVIFKNNVDELDIKVPFVHELIENKQNTNKTGNINDRVYLSKDMETVTIHYEDSSGKECKKEYEFSEEARDYYTQICNNNEFYSKNAQAVVICALMMLNKGIEYKYGGGKCRIEPTTTYDCSKYVDEALLLATGDDLESGDTETLRNKGKEISEDDCMPGDIRQKRNDKDGIYNHVVIYLGKFDDGKWYIIECTRSKGVAVGTRDDVPVCIRLDRLNTNEIKKTINDREGR